MARVSAIGMFRIKEGFMDEFVRLQQQFATTRCPAGLIGGRMYRNRADDKAILISQFESVEAHQSIIGSSELRAHISLLAHMVETSDPDIYDLAYAYGAFE